MKQEAVNKIFESVSDALFIGDWIGEHMLSSSMPKDKWDEEYKHFEDEVKQAISDGINEFMKEHKLVIK